MTTRSQPAKKKPWGWHRLRIGIRSLLERKPRVGGPLLKGWRNAKWRMRQAELNRRVAQAGDEGIADFDRVSFVPTPAIEYLSATEFSFHHNLGAVVPGDWDLSTDRFVDLDVVAAMRAVLVDGGSWPDTAWYQGVLARIERGERPWGCTDAAGLDERCEFLGSLFDSIKTDGYRTQTQLVAAGVVESPRDETAVGVGRTGQLYFTDGAHRLACAKLLGVHEIPIQIAVRHPEWMRFRAAVQSQVEEMGGELYQRPMHPDLESMPHSHGCEDRFDMIEAALLATSGRVLDIGANWGYFCHRLEDKGFDCVAVEQDTATAYFMRTIRDAMRRDFTITEKSVLGTPSIAAEPYSVVLALNIFHHFIKTKERFEQLEGLLDSLRCKELFIEPHSGNEPQMAEAYRPFTGEELVGFVSQHCGLPSVMLLGQVSDGRSLYHLTA